MIFVKDKELSGHSGAVYTCDFNDDLIYSGSADKYVARWKIDEGIQDKFAIRFEHPVYAVETCNNHLFVGLNNGNLHIFDLQSRKELKFFTQHKTGIFCICFNKHLNQTYTADAEGNLCVWNNADLSLLIYLPLDCGKVRNIDVSPDGKEFILGAQDGSIRIFDAITFNELETWHAHENGTTAVLFHPLKKDHIISGGKDALLKEWHRGDQKLLQSVPAHNYAIYQLLVLNDELLVSASRDKVIKIWHLTDLGFVQRLDQKEGGHRHSVNDLARISDDTFVSCSDDGRLIVWRGV